MESMTKPAHFAGEATTGSHLGRLAEANGSQSGQPTGEAAHKDVQHGQLTTNPNTQHKHHKAAHLDPVWTFRLSLLGIGLLLLLLALILRLSVPRYKNPGAPELTCFSGAELTYNNIPIDICALRTSAAGGTQCGAPAADLFCKTKERPSALTFKRKEEFVNNTIALGNSAFGGRETFDEICCDSRSYWPTAPRWLLWVAGVLLLFLISVAVTKVILLIVEVVLVGLVATEALYFFSGFEPILKQVIYCIGLVVWTQEVFWGMWCSSSSRECEDRWLAQPLILLRVARCLMALQIGRLAARTLGKAFGWAYFFRNQLPQVRKVLNQERYLSALSTPHWARALLHAQEEAAAEAAEAQARGGHTLLLGGAPAEDAPPPKFHGGSVLAYLKQDKDILSTLHEPVKRFFERLLAPGGLLSCCDGPGKCGGFTCTRCCGSCCRNPTTVRVQGDDDVQGRVHGGVQGGVQGVAPASAVGSDWLSTPAATTAALSGAAGGAAVSHTTRRPTFPSIPEVHERISGGGGPPVPPLDLPPQPTSPPSSSSAAAQPAGLLKAATIARAGVGHTTTTVAKAGKPSKLPGTHHSSVAGVLEAGLGSPRKPGAALPGDVGLVGVPSAQGTDMSSSPNGSYVLLPPLERRSLPARTLSSLSSATDHHGMSAYERHQAHLHSQLVQKQAAELNADLVAVDVGGIGALRKFQAFLQKFGAMTDDEMEVETRALASRLFNNLKTYLQPPASGAQEGYSFAGMEMSYRGASVLKGAGASLTSLHAVSTSLTPDLARDSQPPPGHMTHAASSPTLNELPGSSSPSEPDTIMFADFLATIRKARRAALTSVSLTRVSTHNLVSTAKDAWQMFDKMSSSKLTEADVRNTLLEVYKSRRNLALSIRANQAVCRSLEAATGFLIQTALVFVYMAIFGLAVAFSSGLDFFKTYVLAFAFIFGDSVKALFQSTIFLFSLHPFDIGDSLVLKAGDSNVWVVESFDLMFTTLYSSSGEWATMTNTSLMGTQLINLSRSKAKSETLKVRVPSAVPLEVLTQVKAAMIKVFEAARGEYVEKSIGCKIAEMENTQSLILAAKWTYTFAPSESARMGKAKSAMQDAVIRTLLEAGVAAIPLQLDFNIAHLKSKTD